MRLLWLAVLSTLLLVACGGGGGSSHQASATEPVVQVTPPTSGNVDDEDQSEEEQTGDTTEGQPPAEGEIALVRDIATEYFRVTNAGFHRASIDETHDEWFYPGPEDRNPAGRFVLVPNSAVAGDFNGDGYEDFAIIWAIFPHTLPRETFVGPSIFINDKKGGFERENSNVDGSTPLRHMLYRSIAADFNGDGNDDLLMGSMGLVFQIPEGQRYEWEPLGYMLSNDDGMLEDASHLIEGQENGEPPENYNFAHDLAVGDFDGDGDLDFYTGKALFFNRGDGSFENRSELLPQDARKADFAMSSVGADFDNDGTDDLVVAWADPHAERYLFLSNGRGISESEATRLPDGTFGVDNTKSNFISAGDINNDGLIDIIIAETRREPYYVGRHIQILVNRGDGNFAD